MSNVSKATPPSRGISYLNMAAAAVIVVAGVRAAEAIVNPLLLAVFLSIISAPAYFGLLKRGVSNWLALLTVIGVLSTLVVAMIFVVMGSIGSFTANADHYRQRLVEEQNKVSAIVSGWIPDAFRLDEAESAEGQPGAVQVGDSSHNPMTDGADNTGSESEQNAVARDSQENAGENGTATETSPSDAFDEAVPDEVLVADAVPDDSAAVEAGAVDRDTVDPDVVDPDVVESAEDEIAKNESGENATGDDTADDATPTAAPPESESIRSAKREAPAPLPSIVFRTPSIPVPTTAQGYLDRLKEQFSPSTVISIAVSIATSLGQLLSNAFLIILIVVFILLEAGGFDRKLRVSIERSEEATRRAQEIIASVHHYIVVKTWVSLATGLLVCVWLWWWGVSHASLWGLLAFLMNYIPNIGSILAAIPAVLIAWLDVGALPAVAIATGLVVINGAIGNFVEPRMMGKSLGLSPLVIFFSMLFWGWVLGPTGMLLSVPLTMTGRIAMDGFDDTRWIATLMGNTQ